MKQFFYDSIDSTNLQARRLLLSGERDFCVRAQRQTAGRGSRGRSFLSQEGGLYCSVVLPKEQLKIPPTILCAAACAKALSQLCRRTVSCKWVNDLILDEKKIGGILAEVCGDFMILGIGVNVNQRDFPLELSHVSSLYQLCGREYDLDEVQQIILHQLREALSQQEQTFSFYKERLLSLHRYVRVNGREGWATALTDSGSLLVHFADSDCIEELHSGIVSIRGQRGYL